MDPNQQKQRGGKRQYEFPVHSERSHAVAAAARAEQSLGRSSNPPRSSFPASCSSFPASNALALERGTYQSPPIAPPAHTFMDVNAHASTEGESQWERERGRSWQYQERPPSLEEEIVCLRKENERLLSRLRLAEFDRQQRDQKMAFLEEQLENRISKPLRRDDSKSSLYYHPYPRPDRSGYSRDSSPGPDHPKRVHKSTTGHKPVAPPPPRTEQSLDTTMTDVSRQSTVPPPPIPSSTAPSSSAAGTLSAPAPTFEEDPYKWDEAQGDDEDWSEDDEDLSRKEKLRRIHVEHKATRERKAIPPPTVSYGSSPELHGKWSGVPIVGGDDWECIYTVALNGDDFALGYIVYLNSTYQRPNETRTAGIRRLLQGFSVLAKTHPEALKEYKAKATAAKRKAGIAAPSSTFVSSTYVGPTTLTLRNPLPEGVDSVDYYISNSLLGHSLALPGPQPREFFEDTTNPHDPPQAVGHDWAATPVARWPLGLRVSDSNGFPREPNEEELAGKPATPDITDVEAVRWISELSPFQCRRDVATRAARHTWNLDAIQVALWFHDHGLYPICPEVKDIERWARLVRGMDGEKQDSEGNWPEYPRNVVSVLEDNPALSNTVTTFQYPPRVPSVHARSWATASERHVDEQRAAQGLSCLFNDEAPGDESADEVMDVKSPPGPSGSA
ncbi:hypothetical protein PILCRDRAFT_8367 [Piloderma croceum F 1598]|uniref:Uncharacterized protein n=1 Tax=Piloderma croceum (strain F 1598) TaxID=765440 RepID=A0A0C3FPN7_PILCF|nr:hypothetical protein PILCRDRAFT_8367 [Piloderma croceum F 1598]